MTADAPRDRHPRTTARPLLAAAAALAAMAAILAGSAPAMAHNVLRSSDPADGAVLSTPPDDVRLDFDQSVLTIGTKMAVIGPKGALALAPLVVDGSTVTQPLDAELPAGSYTVQWRAASIDGHPVSGKVSFTLSAAAATPAPTPAESTPTESASQTAGQPSPLASTQAPAPSVDEGAGLGGGGTLAIAGAAAIALVGAIAALVAKARRPKPPA